MMFFTTARALRVRGNPRNGSGYAGKASGDDGGAGSNGVTPGKSGHGFLSIIK